MEQQKSFNPQRKYKMILPVSLISILLLVLILYLEDHTMKFEFILIFSFMLLMLPLSLLPYFEKISKLETIEEKHLFLFLIYLVILCAQLYGVNSSDLAEKYKTILFAIISALYCFIMTRYLTTILEVIETHQGINKK